MRRPATPWSGKLMGSFKAAHCGSWCGKGCKTRAVLEALVHRWANVSPGETRAVSSGQTSSVSPHCWKSRKNPGQWRQQAEKGNKGLHGQQQTWTRDTWPERSRAGYLWKHAAWASRARCCWRHRQSLLHVWKAAGRALCWKWPSALACNSWGEDCEWPFALYIKNEKSLSRSHSQGRTASDTNTF